MKNKNPIPTENITKEVSTMAFKQKYKITSDLLQKGTNRRPGGKIKVGFIVAHDTGNPGSTAKGNIGYFRNTPNFEAGAHIFSDDKEIRESVPALLSPPERAYHVIYNVTTDNEKYGDDANDIAIGVEMCWGGGINSVESYKRYVWTLAYLCYKFKLDPRRDIVGHEQLDPKRKIDPSNGLKFMGKTYNQLITDVAAEYKECSGQVTAPTPQKPSAKVGKTHVIKAGDTLWALSNKYGKTVGQLKAANPEIDVMALQIGEVLVIDSTVKPAVKPAVKAKPKVDPRLAEFLRHKPVRPYPGRYIKRGARGGDVEAIQRAVGASVDGKFGPGTEGKVKAYQKRFSFLVNDGVVGYNTWNVMF